MSSKVSFPRCIWANAYSRVSIAVLLCFIALALVTARFSDLAGAAASDPSPQQEPQRRVAAIQVKASPTAIAGALALAWLNADPSQILSAQTISLIFDPDVAAGAAQSQNKAVPSAQGGHEWDGIAPVPDPLERTGSYDFHEFDVLANFDNDSMDVGVTWDAGAALAYDLDLYVDRLIDGVWTPVGQSTNGQAAGEGDPAEGLSMPSPTPGRYRTRVHNWASTQIMYHGTVGFTSDGIITKQKKVKIVGGRATADRPDTTDLARIHTIYFVPTPADLDGDGFPDDSDNQLDINGTLDDALAAMNLWFESETGGRRMRLDTYSIKGAVRPDITFVRGMKTAAEYAADDAGAFTAITSELAQRGWNAYPGAKRYLVYYEGPAESAGICGTAFLTLGSGFAQWSVVFLGAAPGCGARDFGSPELGAGVSESIAVQEMLHNEGQTVPEAIHHCAANQFHICTALAGSQLTRIQRGLDPESVDALFPFVTFALRDKKLDKDKDDYYNHPFLHRDFAFSPFWE